MATSRDLGWWYWFMTVGLLGAGLLGWTVGLRLAIQPLSLDFVARTFFSHQSVMPSCAEVFQRPWLKRVHK